ncbi:amino acid permease [Enteractinococcus coprophilus]|uniref:Amino acid permease n=2 Tax=Enteractinococcus coprophilus TaxID=1027633 RepID=A0A543AJ17_9MICC|nr:amino acid permease [Enteractinococcus coprophilus]
MGGSDEANDRQRPHGEGPVHHARTGRDTTLAPEKRLRRWMLADTAVPHGRHAGPHGRAEHHERAHWLRVMCLTGLDYFSTLGYQPAIAALAAGVIAPAATIVLVLVTLAGALPVYRRVAQESPHGTGSIAMLAKLLPRWTGKFAVLILLGFVVTDFVITMTLSASDATAHLSENPITAPMVSGREVVTTLVLLAGLALIFLWGFREAIRVATVLVIAFLTVNLIVIIVAMTHMFQQPVLIDNWWTVLTTQHGDPLFVVAIALLVFPKLALGLSGFETGVVVMPQIRGDPTDTEAHPTGRIRHTKQLLTTSALIMSGFLITSSLTTVVLIPAAAFEEGGPANGRALAYLAHEYLGPEFGTVYDVIMVAILWFAGASAMAGLLNLVPRYLPHYGMAPAWTQRNRPLVFVFVAITFIITIIFQADVDAQGGAYATGVLVLITSAAIAVTLAARHKGQRGATIGYGVIAVIFTYTTVANIIERPDGIKIAGSFIMAILVVSLISRALRSTELRATSIHFDAAAQRMLADHADGVIRLIAHNPRHLAAQRYRDNLRKAQLAHDLRQDGVLFIEVVVADSSEFETDVIVHGVQRYGHQVLVAEGTTVANTIAAVALHLRDALGCETHVYFQWTEATPVTNILRYLVFGEGAVAPVTREVLREAEPDVHRRPIVHVA